MIGKGIRLAGTDGDQSSSLRQDSPSLELKPMYMKLKMWRNGFSVDDGPLRCYDDQESKEFLDSISRGEVPRELIAQARGAEVNLNMEDHRSDDYVPVKKKLEAFSGEGHRLGVIVPETISSSIHASHADEKEKNEKKAQQKLAVDSSKPVTSIQVRLADGSR